jgi:hypothetical protein
MPNQFPYGVFWQAVVNPGPDAPVAMLSTQQTQISLPAGYRVIVDGYGLSMGLSAGTTILYIDINGNQSYDAGEEIGIFSNGTTTENDGMDHGLFSGCPSDGGYKGLLRTVQTVGSPGVILSMFGRIIQG